MSSQLDEFRYVIGLAPGKTSFYDPVSKCNLFLTRKVFGFNIEPTTNILRGLKAGVLIDIKGNLKETDTVRLAPDQLSQIRSAEFTPEQLAQIQSMPLTPEQLAQIQTAIVQEQDGQQPAAGQDISGGKTQRGGRNRKKPDTPLAADNQ